MKFVNDQYYKCNDSESLIRYSNALQFFTQRDMMPYCGIVYNNIGNIHMMNERYIEGIMAYRKSVEIAQQQIEKQQQKQQQKKSVILKPGSLPPNHHHKPNLSDQNNITIDTVQDRDQHIAQQLISTQEHGQPSRFINLLSQKK